ncbi:MAG TPA: ATP-binding protein [Candidatus Udaeobacter sp.]|nr:ATP-binding protein [Candidatus Udaeobacter sp.]
MATRPRPLGHPLSTPDSGSIGAPPASRVPARIYFVGAHATGKTTLARYVRDRYGLPLISEVARSILAELEVSLDRLRANLDLVNCYQVEVFRRQIEAERDAGDTFVSDRAFCNLAYMAHHGTVMHELFRDPALEAYMRWVAGGLVFFVRPHPELAQSDAVRTAVRFEDIVLIDGMVKLLLEMYAVPYLTIATLSMQERVRTVDEVIRLRYPALAPLRARRRDEAAAGEPTPAKAQAQAQAQAPAQTQPAKAPAPAVPAAAPGPPAIPTPPPSNGGIADPLLTRYRDLSFDVTPDS